MNKIRVCRKKVLRWTIAGYSDQYIGDRLMARGKTRVYRISRRKNPAGGSWWTTEVLDKRLHALRRTNEMSLAHASKWCEEMEARAV